MNNERQIKQTTRVEEDSTKSAKTSPFDIEAMRNQKFEAQRSLDTHVPMVSFRFDTEARELF